MMLLILAVAVTSCAKDKEVEGTHAETGANAGTQTAEEIVKTEAEEQTETIESFNVYGCELYGVYEYPWNQMSQDWGYEDVEGFYYHEITEECKAEGGSFPVIAQVYTYIVCKNAGVDYEVVFALIEQESSCVWNISGDSGKSIGLMQVAEKWHKDRMERLGCTDMTNPYQNIMVGVDFLAELLKEVEQEDKQLQYADALAAYNYGMTGAKKHLWDNGIHWYSYNTEIMKRAEELKQEKVNALEKRGRSVEE